MRVCFDTFCFSSLHATDEEANTTPTIRQSIIDGGTNQHQTVLIQEPITTTTIMGTAPDLQVLLQLKDEKINELETLLRLRDEEIANLRSHLDKFQSVVPIYFNPASPKHNITLNNNILKRRKQRTGISAEPQSETSLFELSRQIFPKYEKDER